MENLHKDILVEIASSCSLRDLFSFILTCKKIYKVLSKHKNKNVIWMKNIQRDFIEFFNDMCKINNNYININKLFKPNWERLYKFKYLSDDKHKAKVKYIKICEKCFDEEFGKVRKWKNISGLRPNVYEGFDVVKDKNTSWILYLFPSTFYCLETKQIPKENENYSVIMLKAEFNCSYLNEIVTTEIPWNEDIFGESLKIIKKEEYRVSWYDEFFLYKYEYNWQTSTFSVFLIDIS